jgi:hypothetical protein
MSSKAFIWIGLLIGSSIGGAIPLLWHDSLLSMSSVFLSATGGIFGIWFGYKICKLI